MNTSKKFSKGIHADPDGYYMSIPEVASIHIAQQLSSYKSAVELCSAVGMMVVQLAKFMPMAYGVELDKQRVVDAQKTPSYTVWRIG